jgi:hypothetical protein
MAENNDPPRRSQPFLDTLKVIKALKRSPIWRQQQETIAKLRERLALPPDLAEAIKQARESEMEPAAEATTPTEAPASTGQRTISEALPTANDEEPTTPPPSSETAPPKRKPPKLWSADWMKTNPRRKGEGPGEYAQRMCDAMTNATDVTEPWSFENCRRELYRSPKEADFEPDSDSLQTFPKHR